MAFTAFVAAIFCFLLNAEFGLTQDCPAGFAALPTGSTNCYLIDLTNRITWLEAKERCNSLGATLAVLDSSSKNTAVGNNISSQASTAALWIGLYDQGHEGTYTWLTTGATTANYASWNTGYPKADNTSNCGATGIGANGNLWQNTGCSTTHGYVCEKSSVTTASPLCPSPTGNGCPNHAGWLAAPKDTPTNCYYTDAKTSATFIEAQEICAQKGTSLATFSSLDDWNDFLVVANGTQYFYNGLNFWIGLYDQGHEGQWFWNGKGPVAADCDSFTSAWYNGAPTFDVTKNCAVMNGNLGNNFVWSVADCTKANLFICQLPTECFS